MKKPVCILLLFAAIFFLRAGQADAYHQMVLPLSQDTYTYNQTPGTNYVSSPELGVSNTWPSYAYILPQTSALPSGAVITGGEVVVFVVGHGWIHTRIHGVAAPWNPHTITWSNQPGVYTYSAVGVYLSSGNWYITTINEIAKKWNTHPFGLRIGGPPGPEGGYRSLASLEYGVPDHKPVVRVYYVLNPTDVQTSATQTSVTLSWSNSAPGITHSVYRNGNLLYRGTNYNYTETGLQPGTQYAYTIKTTVFGADGAVYETPGVTVSRNTVPPTPSAPSGTTSGLAWSQTTGRGQAVLNWPSLPTATGYKLWVFDGNTYRSFDLGNVTSWNSSVAKIYPDENWLKAQADNSVSNDPFHRAQGGFDLRDRPTGLYLKTIGTTHDNNQDYLFRLSAYNESGESPLGPAASVVLPNRTDPENPAGSMTIMGADGSGRAHSPDVRLSVTAVDNQSGVRGVQLSNDNIVWSQEQPPAPEIPWTLTPGTGSKTVYARIWDNVGNSSVVSGAIALVEDAVPPSVNLLVNGGATSTTSGNVTLTISVNDNTSLPGQIMMSFSNDGLLWSEWESYKQTKNWDITAVNYGGSAQPGKKTVHCRVYDQSQNIGRAMVEIGYNSDPPVLSLTVAGGVNGISDGQEVIFTDKDRITFNLASAGASRMRFDIGMGAWSDWMDFAANKSVVLAKSSGGCKILAQVMDQYGVVSAPVEKTILIDSEKPVIRSFKTLSGAVATSGGSIQAVLDVSDNISETFTYSLDGASYAPLPAGGVIALPVNSPGPNVITVRVKDQAGNIGRSSITIRRL